VLYDFEVSLKSYKHRRDNHKLIMPFSIMGSQDNVISIMTRLQVGHLRIGVQFLAEARDFSLLCNIQADSWAHPASCKLGLRCCFSGVKQQAWNWSLISIWGWGFEWWTCYTFTLLYVFMAWCLLKCNEIFTFTFDIMAHSRILTVELYRFFFYHRLCHCERLPSDR
jgi:hypothetical protein